MRKIFVLLLIFILSLGLLPFASAAEISCPHDGWTYAVAQPLDGQCCHVRTCDGCGLTQMQLCQKADCPCLADPEALCPGCEQNPESCTCSQVCTPRRQGQSHARRGGHHRRGR